VEAVVGERGRVGVRAQQEVGGLDVAVNEAVGGVQVRHAARGAQRSPHPRLPVHGRPAGAPAPCVQIHGVLVSIPDRQHNSAQTEKSVV